MKLNKRKIKNLSVENLNIKDHTRNVAGGFAQISGHDCNLLPKSIVCNTPPQTINKLCLNSMFCPM